jgi:plastocyanin
MPRRNVLVPVALALSAGVGGAVVPVVALAAAPGSKASPVATSISPGFKPSTVTAKPGAVVYFKNVDGAPHNAVATKKAKGKPVFTSGSATSGSFKFTAPKTPGTYTFTCTVHGFTGKLRVKR